VERGVDVVKIMATGGNLTPGSSSTASVLGRGDAAAVDEAHRWGLPITAHAHATQGIENAVRAGVDGLEHASFWSEDGVDDPGETIEHIVEKRIVVGLTVGLAHVPGE
jgi:imidazolonepropionase-like amidohydrolase